MNSYDLIVVGAGPNGLAAAIVAAGQGLSTLLIDGADTVGGGTRTSELTLPGFVHDECSAVHPMAAASPLFRALPLGRYGLEWITPPVACAHPLDDGTAPALMTSLDQTAEQLGRDADAYRAAMGWLVANWARVAPDILSPIGIPTHPLAFARFGVNALWPAAAYARTRFASERARALFAGIAAHSVTPLEHAGSTAIGLVLAAVAHVHGWPVPRGGSQAIATALAAHFTALGGTITTGWEVASLGELPPARAVLFDGSPRALAKIAGARLSAGVRRAFERYRYGPGAFKVDWALSEPISWTAPACREATTVHVGGTLAEVARAERAAWYGEFTPRPGVLVTQPSLFDASRAPAGRHTAWAYCHVPNGSSIDMTDHIEAQIERFAPGFRDCILARAVRGTASLEQRNPNYVGGDIAGGANDLLQLLLRPTWRTYGTGTKGLYLCSSSTPPGGGVHGMCGYHAAVRAIREVFGLAVAREPVATA